MNRSIRVLAALLTAGICTAQGQTTELQSVGFNSSFTLTQAQIEAANISAGVAADIENAIRYDFSQLAFGGPGQDDFYTLPPLTLKCNSTTLKPGVLLKVQDYTNTSGYVLPPNLALSRILYTTKNLNGTVVPASGFVLWPFQPRQFSTGNSKQGAPVILWAHGTAGLTASRAPSAHRALWYGDNAPFSLALAGYAVVAPDYAGLGISASWDGSPIPHQYETSPAGAYDALYGLRAAWEAFPGQLQSMFIAMGHSQGGGVAWSIAELLEAEVEAFADLAKGYRGTIAGSPMTNLFASPPWLILTWLSTYLKGVYPSFDPSEWLTPLGLARVELLRQVQGGTSVSKSLFLDSNIYKPEWNETWYVNTYAELANAGRKPFAGPLLVLQGTGDTTIPYPLTNETVDATCALLEKSNKSRDLEFLVVNGTGHVPTLDATRQTWLRWIEDRFEGVPLQHSGCFRTEIESFRPLQNYQPVINSFIQWAGAADQWFEKPLP
ncbi:hypothetical protein F5B22DRAFT_375938 [Xylaria bambusicola]|uniref:uncharacterized protein n=1 Tax=Xylaria bambusicola TaxID=326684 RepID=UPI00200843F9|nr:uncharacterized protein F5B22DRAFT_375938 [Xylaria bambusicola]KAI0508993.1 hypothetical protein F5B22DRAFT_375938 [Xylaria bambusicola]